MNKIYLLKISQVDANLNINVVFSDYNNNTDLHIAVTTSQGTIVEYDSHGLRKHVNNDKGKSWEQCLVVESVPEAWWDYWDEVLSKVDS